MQPCGNGNRPQQPNEERLEGTVPFRTVENNRAIDLRGLKVFVGGPIQYAIQPRGFAPFLRDAILHVITAIQQVNGEVSSAHLAEQFGAKTARFTPAEVTVRDFTWMNQCDVFVPILPAATPDSLLRTDGTHIELGWASALEKPIVLLTSQHTARIGSHLLRGLSTIASLSSMDIDDVVQHPARLLEELSAIKAKTDGSP